MSKPARDTQRFEKWAAGLVPSQTWPAILNQPKPDCRAGDRAQLHSHADEPILNQHVAVTRSRLIGVLARALRHIPEEYGIQLDVDGWADFGTLLQHIRNSSSHWAWLSERDLLWLLQTDTDNRFQYHEGRIRALYGHSVSGVRIGVEQSPPPDLYHATATDLLPSILRDGLRSMARRHVHLTSDRSYAAGLGARLVRWTLLGVNVPEAIQTGLRFYRANRHVWQTDFVQARLLHVVEQREISPTEQRLDATGKRHPRDTMQPQLPASESLQAKGTVP